MTPPPIEAVTLVTGLAIASWTDIRTGQIHNALTGSMMLAGLLIHVLYGQPLVGVVGLGAAFALHFPLWLVNVEKGGDTKLMMGLGALVGWPEMIEASLWYAIIYLPVGLTLIVVRGRVGNLWRAGQWMVLKATGAKPGEAPEATMLKTAPIIAAAGILGLIGDWLRWVVV